MKDASLLGMRGGKKKKNNPAMNQHKYPLINHGVLLEAFF